VRRISHLGTRLNLFLAPGRPILESDLVQVYWKTIRGPNAGSLGCEPGTICSIKPWENQTELASLRSAMSKAHSVIGLGSRIHQHQRATAPLTGKSQMGRRTTYIREGLDSPHRQSCDLL
jgi:hypothetical protein